MNGTHFTDTKEFHDLVKEFKRVYNVGQMPMESPDVFRHGAFFCNGELNQKFNAFMNGYMVARSMALSGEFQ